MTSDADLLIDRRRLKRRLTLWRAATVGLVVLGLVLIIPWTGEKDEPHIARVHIGTLIGEELERSERLEEIRTDENVRAVLLHINSPGGTVAASEALYYDLRALAGDKPVIAFIGTVGASGGYIAAISADWIVARRNAITGSIGVIFRAPEFSGLMENIGVGLQELKAGDIKGEPSFAEPMSDQAREALQATLDDSYDWFISLVSERRGINREDLLPLADGRIFTGTQAAEVGLVDETGGEDRAVARLTEQHGLETDLPVVDYLKEDEPGGAFAKLLNILGLSNSSGSTLALDGLLALWQP